ncbi:hypothetical protein LTR08_004165 [Meristemomyces frigidus]|nr:hypothetical protein LTR08_004165 [Meristemomyces frigidus]
MAPYVKKYGESSDGNLDLARERVRHALQETRQPRVERELKRILIGHRYGNTQAMIIGCFSNSNGTEYRIFTTDDDLVDEASQERIAINTRLLEADQYTRDNRATCKPAHVAFAAYSGFRPREPTTVKFMDLPGEIRNRIYRLFLVVEPEINLSPRSSDCSNAGTLERQTRARLTKLKPILRILRLSPDIHTEASDIFYGENEFRFGGCMGWSLLLAFLRKIGPANVARLRRLSAPVPYAGSDTGSAESLLSAMQMGGLDLYRMGLQDDDSDTPSFEASIRGCVKILERAGKLETLRLLLPFSLELADEYLKPFKLNRAKFDNLTVMLVHLRKHIHEQPDSSQTPTYGGRNFPGQLYETCRYEDPKAWAMANGWEYASVWYDYKGRFTVHNCAGEDRFCSSSNGAVENCECEVAVAMRKWYKKT